MHTIRVVALFSVLASACSGGGGGRTARLDEAGIAGRWAELGEDDRWRVLEFRTSGDLHTFRFFEYPDGADAVEVQHGSFAADGSHVVTTVEHDANGVPPGVYALEVVSFSSTRLVLASSTAPDGTREFDHVEVCPPVGARGGDWFWSDVAKSPYGTPLDPTSTGWVDLELGPVGPVLIHHDSGAGGAAPHVGLLYGERDGCGSTHEVVHPGTAYLNRLAFTTGERHVLTGAGSIAYFRHTEATGWTSNLIIPVSGFVNLSSRAGIATASDGTVYMSHTGNLMPTDTSGAGPAVSSWLAGAPAAYSRIEDTNTHVTSAVALDAAGNPVVAYTEPASQTLRLATTSNGGWSIAQLGTGAAAAAPNASTGGIAMASDAAGRLHIAWVGDLGGPSWEVRYTTNASGSWVTTPLGQGIWVDLVLDDQGDAHLSFLRTDVRGTRPFYATNRSGSWTAEAVEAADSQPPAFAVPESSDNRTAIAVDADGNVHIATGDYHYATNAY